jgi:hypothetical protein
MNENIEIFIIVGIGSILSVIGGIWLIIWSYRFPEPLLAKKLGWIVSLLSLVVIILVIIFIFLT